MDDDFSERTRSFLSWFQSRRSNISPKIQLADLRYRNSGRGVGKSSLLSSHAISIPYFPQGASSRRHNISSS
ncbi:hypothetical protein AAFC00_003469 [Neodothiora populina]|uniref:Uncharacterized protein n=1 Tax=Neodothiora populina TaxID=2781224 RepID=A0ABR3PEC1_9PEZI